MSQKREGHSDEMQKKNENTTVSNKQKKTHYLRIQLLAELSSGILLKLCCHLKKNSTIQRHRGARSIFCVLSHKNNVRQNCVFSRVFSYHIGGTCPVKEFSWSEGCIFGPKKMVATRRGKNQSSEKSKTQLVRSKKQLLKLSETTISV